MTAQEKARDSASRYYYAKRSDPAWVLERNRRQEARRKERMETDPNFRSKVVEARKLNYARRMDRMSNYPEEYLEYRNRKNASGRKWYNKMSMDPNWMKQQCVDSCEFARNNRDKVNAYKRLKKKNDINFKISEHCRSRISQALRGNVKRGGLEELIGCTVQELKSHLESKFKDGMSWDNYGCRSDQWSMDHSVPCASFNLSIPEEQKKCFHYSNVVPMWHPENCSKNSIVNGTKMYYGMNYDCVLR